MTTSFKKFKTKTLKDKEVKKAYDAMGPEYEVVRAIIRHRIKRGWTQTQLAERIGSRQPVISRLEKGEGNPSLQTLQRLANALELSLHVSMK